MSPKKLPRDLVFMDEQGRLIIPKFIREALGIKTGEKTPLTVEIYPNMDNPKAIIIRKE